MFYFFIYQSSLNFSVIHRTFRTETRDNYTQQSSQPISQIYYDNETEARSEYKRSIAKLQTNTQQEQSSVKLFYTTENSHIGSGEPICSIIDQYLKKNKKLEMREIK